MAGKSIETDLSTLPVMTDRVNAGFWCNAVENGDVTRISAVWWIGSWYLVLGIWTVSAMTFSR
jgi:hypothetical protein